MAGARILNREKFKARLANLPAAIVRELEVPFGVEVESLAEAVKRAVPVKTGVLQSTVRVEAGDNPLTKRIVVGGVPATRKKVRKGVKDSDFAKAKAAGNFTGEYDYALGVEFGHRTEGGEHVPAEPFLFPTYRARRKGMSRRLKAKARKAVKQQFPG